MATIETSVSIAEDDWWLWRFLAMSNSAVLSEYPSYIVRVSAVLCDRSIEWENNTLRSQFINEMNFGVKIRFWQYFGSRILFGKFIIISCYQHLDWYFQFNQIFRTYSLSSILNSGNFNFLCFHDSKDEKKVIKGLSMDRSQWHFGNEYVTFTKAVFFFSSSGGLCKSTSCNLS